MKNHRKIFIDKITNNFNPKEDLVLGPWCLKHDFSIEKIYEFKSKGIFFEDNLIENSQAFCSVESQHKRLLEEISFYVKDINRGKESIDFYKNFLNYWFYYFINVFHFSERIADLYINKFKNENIELIKYYECNSLTFKNVHEFYNKTAYDEVFLSNLVLDLIKIKIPQNWKITYLDNFNHNNKIIENLKNESLLHKVFKFLDKILSSRVRNVYGFGKFERIILSLILVIKSPLKKDFIKCDYYSNLSVKPFDPPISDKKLMELAKKYIPLSFTKILKKKVKKRNLKGKIMLCSAPSLFTNEEEQFKLLSFKENGGKLLSVQHGSSYGDLFFQCNQAEYSFDKFISWGHKNHPNFNLQFEPLPSPQLKKMKQSMFSKKILFVTTSCLFYVPRYGKRDFSDSFFRYRNTIDFFNKINPDLLKKIEFKDMNPHHFSEVDVLKKKYKNLKFIKEKPEKKIKETKLVIINNYSTFFYKCLASNIPTMLLTKPDTWKLHDKAKKIFDLLQESGIAYYDMDLAVKKINENLNEINLWWKSEKIQKARNEFCKEFAWSSNNYLNYWINYLWKL